MTVNEDSVGPSQRIGSVSTGSEILDRMLDGGLLRRSSVLLTGGPGTGKSTLGMQFLQAGLGQGDRCLFISTEQTTPELEVSFAPFDFDLDHENLLITSLHASPGLTFKSDEEGALTLQTLDGEDLLGRDHSPPFIPEYISRYVEEHGPCDRVVFDSISGIAAMAESRERFRRAILDLIQVFSDEFEATSILIAEETGNQPTTDAAPVETVSGRDAIQFNAHGVIRLWRESVAGEYHRYLEIRKMRGVGHDTRTYGIEFADDGIRLLPRLRHHPVEFLPTSFLTTGIPNLDTLLGGGIVTGGAALFQYDGEATPHTFLVNILSAAAEADMALLFVPSLELPPKTLRDIFDSRIGEMRDLLDEDRLFLIDMVNVWENSHPNVFKPSGPEGSFEDIYNAVDERRDGTALFSLINVESQIPSYSPEEIRRARFWEEENFYREDDTAIYFYNPNSIPDKLDAFYTNGASQVISTWMSDRGLQYITVNKSPSGFMGMTRAVEYVDQEPFIRIQRPPGGVDGGS